VPTYKISSYNVNGIRAAERKGFSDWVKQEQPDVICLQEIKADSDQVPQEVLDLGYHCEWLSAEKKGYSGVAILSKQKPLRSQAGMGLDWVDSEGRVLMFEFPEFNVYSIYAPSGTSGSVRQDLKYEFLDAFMNFAKSVQTSNKPVIFCGDFNIAHREIDIHDPVRNKKSSGFLPEERAWFTKFLESGFVDVFREKNPDLRDVYSWWTYRAGAKGNNKGWRIDYHLASPEMLKKATETTIQRELDMSDHVPVTIVYTFP